MCNSISVVIVVIVIVTVVTTIWSKDVLPSYAFAHNFPPTNHCPLLNVLFLLVKNLAQCLCACVLVEMHLLYIVGCWLFLRSRNGTSNVLFAVYSKKHYQFLKYSL